MKQSDDRSGTDPYPLPPNPDEVSRIQEQHTGYGAPPAFLREQLSPVGKRSKWLAGLLAFLIPGIGHMYLGRMVKGIVLMLLIALDITAIVYVSIGGHNVLSIVLLSLLLPIIYFYNLFDAIQSTDIVNERRATGTYHLLQGFANRTAYPAADESMARGVPPVGILFLAAAGVVIVIVADTGWTHWLFNSVGSMLGAIVLIGAGVGLWFWETRGRLRDRR
jgi:peptidoglycan/LPS O-acetylase OafA/YrhL